MKKSTSLYLDVVRFCAALMVFAEHLGERTRNGFRAFWTAHPWWTSHSFDLSQIAVAVFFVLSGYVIAHVTATRERTALDYAASRFARLYSVVIPALLLIALCDYLITRRLPHAYDNFIAHDPMAFRFLGNLFFVKNFWLWSDLGIPNAPFWSLSYEAAYYAGAGLILFASGYFRVFAVILLALVAGPSILLAAPVWIGGFVTYRLSQRIQLPAVIAAGLLLMSAWLLVKCCWLLDNLNLQVPYLNMPEHTLGELLTYYAAGACFAVSVIAFNSFGSRTEAALAPFTNVIRWLGSLTFALYVFHEPLVSLFSVYRLATPGTAAQAVVLIGVPLLAAATLGRTCEQSKTIYKKCFVSAWERVSDAGARHLSIARRSALKLH